jgi:hypothetical protein
LATTSCDWPTKRASVMCWQRFRNKEPARQWIRRRRMLLRLHT